ncbi:hypothetical protein Tco_1403986 [Tanacetum coccineum]
MKLGTNRGKASLGGRTNGPAGCVTGSKTSGSNEECGVKLCVKCLEHVEHASFMSLNLTESMWRCELPELTAMAKIYCLRLATAPFTIAKLATGVATSINNVVSQMHPYWVEHEKMRRLSVWALRLYERILKIKHVKLIADASCLWHGLLLLWTKIVVATADTNLVEVTSQEGMASFLLRGYKLSPFFILDEVDAAQCTAHLGDFTLLEKMSMDFQQELELHKKHTPNRTQVETAKIKGNMTEMQIALGVLVVKREYFSLFRLLQKERRMEIGGGC